MLDKNLQDRLEGLFSGLDEPDATLPDDPPDSPAETFGPGNGHHPLPQPYLPPEPGTYPAGRPAHPGVHWRLIIWLVLGSLAALLLAAYSQAIFSAAGDEQQAGQSPRFVVPVTATPSLTPSATPTPLRAGLTIVEPTVTPTSAPGGRVLLLRPSSAGWVSSADVGEMLTNHLGDPLLFAGSFDGQTTFAVIQFNLANIPRGSTIYGAELRLTGSRGSQNIDDFRWTLAMLPPELDYHWAAVDHRQIRRAQPWNRFEPALRGRDLAEGRANTFSFSDTQRRLLERRLLESSERSGRWVSFRISGPTESNALFAWNNSDAPPQLFLNVGPAPEEPPPPVLVVVTSTPTPESVETAAALSLQMTAQARQDGTATPLPPNWVTPDIVTATPTAENAATAQIQREVATAIALTTGEPPNRQVVTATPTPNYVVITSTPTAESVETAVAVSRRLTAEATRDGTATPLPTEWVTPLVVTSTPAPANTATVEYMQALALTTGTPTPLPGNAQTATPTPVALAVNLFASPTATATPSPTPQPLPVALLGKILFLSDREGATEQERERAARRQATPQVTPQPFAFDPATGRLERLTDRWPYDVAAARERWSPDGQFEAYNQQLLWVSNPRLPQMALHVYDHTYNVERQLSQMGTGIVYDPAWSPTRDELVFVATETGNDEVWRINHSDGAVQQLTRNDWAWDKHPSFSPDGEQVVFYSNRTGTNQLWVMNRDGSAQQLLMDANGYNDFDPVWVKTLSPAPALERLPDWRFTKNDP